MNSGRCEAEVAECKLCFRILTLDPSTISYTAFNCGHVLCGPCIHGTPALTRTCPICGMNLGMWGFAASITMLSIPSDLEAEILTASQSVAQVAVNDANHLEHSSRIYNEVLNSLDDEGSNHNNNNQVDINNLPSIAHATERCDHGTQPH